MASTARNEIVRRQLRWAAAFGVPCDSRGFVHGTHRNLHAAPSDDLLAELMRGSELTPGVTRPPRMWSLCSSAALVANVFAHWRTTPNRPLLDALGVAAESACVSFEEPLPTGLNGDPPTTDVALRVPGGGLIAIESKFCEWLVRRPRNKAVFKPKYFPDGDGVWSRAGLPRCQALAEDIHRGRERFKLLHAAQLLKHALGLAVCGEPTCELVYLYYDWPCRESAVHRAELERFAARAAGEIRLRALTYQSVFRALSAADGVDAAYLAYLRLRYFS